MDTVDFAGGYFFETDPEEVVSDFLDVAVSERVGYGAEFRLLIVFISSAS